MATGLRIPRLKAFTLFKSGKTVTDIAATRGLTVATIEGHLSYYIYNGTIDLHAIVKEEKIPLIKGMPLKVTERKNYRR